MNPHCYLSSQPICFALTPLTLFVGEQSNLLATHNFPLSQSGWRRFIFTVCRFSRAFQIIKSQPALMSWSTLDFPQYLAFKGTISMFACYLENVKFFLRPFDLFETLLAIVWRAWSHCCPRFLEIMYWINHPWKYNPISHRCHLQRSRT